MEHAHHVQESNQDLDTLLKGRDTRWWRGSLGRLNLIILLLLITSMHVFHQSDRGRAGKARRAVRYSAPCPEFPQSEAAKPSIGIVQQARPTVTMAV